MGDADEQFIELWELALGAGLVLALCVAFFFSPSWRRDNSEYTDTLQKRKFVNKYSTAICTMDTTFVEQLPYLGMLSNNRFENKIERIVDIRKKRGSS